MQQSTRFARLAWAFLASALVVGLPAGYLTFALNRRSWTPEYVALWMSLGFWLIAWGLRFAPLSTHAKTVRCIVIGGALLLSATVVWNLVYAEHARQPTSDTSRGEFRRKRDSRHWPVYGVYEFHGLPRTIPAVVAMGATIGFLVRAHRRRDPVDWRFVSTLALLNALTALAFAFSEDRLSAMVLSDGFRYGLESFDAGGPRDLLRRYVELQPHLGSFNSHYPPGFMLLMQLERITGLRFVAALVFISVPLTLLPLWRLVIELGGDDTTQRWALGLFCTSMGIVIFSTITPIALLVFVATIVVLCLTLSLRASTAKNAVISGIVLAASTAVYAFLSFSVGMLMLMLMMACAVSLSVTVNHRQRKLLRITSSLVIAAITFVAIFLILRITTGFDWLACLAESRENLLRSNGDYFDTPLRFALRATGNLLAYLFSCGFALAVPAIIPRGESARAWRWATLVTLVVAACIGVGRLETERVWLFFTPILCVAAAFWYVEREGESTDYATFLLTLLASGCFACAMELTYQHY